MDKNKVPDFSNIGKDLLKEAHRIAATESVKFFKQSFVKEGFTDISFSPWKKTTNPMASKRTLFGSGERGHLMQSIRKTEETPTRIVIESDKDYSEIHNEGGSITVTVQMKKFFWAKYYELSGQVKTTRGGTASSMSKANRVTGTKVMFFKRMALMKVGSKIHIPKRQFMGNSQTMMNIFNTLYKEKIDISFKQHLNK